MIRAFIASAFLALFILIFGPPFILHAIVTGSVEVLYRMGVRGLRATLWLAGVRVRVEGLEYIPKGVCVFAANHTSDVDPLAIVAAIPRRVAVLAKKEIFRVPIVSTALRMASIVPVDRSDREAAMASVEKAVEHLKAGISFLVYPEGTRSLDGRLLPFKKGTFVMAIQAGVPVVPVAVAGAQKRRRKGEWAIHPGEVVVKFQPPVPTSGYSLGDRGELLARVYASLAAGLPEDQQPLDVARSRG